MSQKIEKPTLVGQRIRTRKRDEKEKYDPAGFRDIVIQGLNEAGKDLDALSKFLDTSSSKLDYRRYGETLFDILLAGGNLAPGGSIVIEPDPTKPSKTEFCIFAAENDLELLRGYAQVFMKLIRRYKYLEKTLEDEFKKVLVFLKGFTVEDRQKLAKVCALLIAGGQVPPTVLSSTLQDHLVKDGIALEFVMMVLKIWLDERDSVTVWASLRKAGLDNRLLEFLPVSRRSLDTLSSTFKQHGLDQLMDFQKAQENASVKKELQTKVSKSLQGGNSFKEIIPVAKEYQTKYGIPDHEIVVLLWASLMSVIEWNKKEELVSEQALKHLNRNAGLLSAFAQSAKSEMALLVKIQEFCYDNMNFLKIFRKIVVLLYKTEVLTEDVILKWYKEGHSGKGKSIFLEQMKKFVEWLQNAEEESEAED